MVPDCFAQPAAPGLAAPTDQSWSMSGGLEWSRYLRRSCGSDHVRPTRANCPAGGRVGQRLVAGGDPRPVIGPAVIGVPARPGSVAVPAWGRDLAGQGVEFQQRMTVRADVAHSAVAAARPGLT
jgi:hypothetical protein